MMRKSDFTRYFLATIILSHFSCNPKKTRPVGNISNEEIVKELGTDLMELWETGDTMRTKTLFLTASTYTDVANAHVFHGIQEINNYVNHIHTWASDIKMTIRNMQFSNEAGYIEWTLSAKQTKPIKGRIPVATNNNILLEGVSLIEVRAGKIAKAADYMDVLGFVMQLGSKVELPGGMVIGGQK